MNATNSQIHVWTQADIDRLAQSTEFPQRTVTITRTDGALSLDEPLPVGELHIRGDSIFERIGGGVRVESLAGTATVGSLSDQASVLFMSGDAQIRRLDGEASVVRMSDRAFIASAGGNARIETMHDRSMVVEVIDNASVHTMNDHAVITALNTTADPSVHRMTGRSEIPWIKNGVIAHRDETTRINTFAQGLSPTVKPQISAAQHQLYVDQHQAAIDPNLGIGRDI